MRVSLLGAALCVAGSLPRALAWWCFSECVNGRKPRWWSWWCVCDEGWQGGCCDEPGCPDVQVSTEVDLDEWTRATWYVQQQQVSDYSPADNLYCVTATWSRDTDAKVPFFRGEVLSVYNQANTGAVDGPLRNENNRSVCARLPNPSQPGKLRVAACFLPNRFSRPYWIIGIGTQADGKYTWAVVIGGQPTESYDDGCTTTTWGNGGLWLLSREPVASDETIQAMMGVLTDQGISKSQLVDVEQAGCSYAGAFIKS